MLRRRLRCAVFESDSRRNYRARLRVRQSRAVGARGRNGFRFGAVAAGKICYIAAQIVGASGRVIGVDINGEMLALAEKYKTQIGDELGFHNVEFVRGQIQDLKPIIASDSIDVVLSNCVLNLVETAHKAQLFGEMFRVVKEGGRVVISDIVSDVEVPQAMRDDAELWSGCISGAYEEKAFVEAFENAGWSDVKIVKRDETPWQTVEGIAFRSVTVQALSRAIGRSWSIVAVVVELRGLLHLDFGI